MAALFGLCAALSIGLSDLFGRRIVSASSPVTAGTGMQLVGSVFIISFALVTDSPFAWNQFAWGAVSGLGIGAGIWCYYSGLTVASSAVVAPIGASLSALLPFAYTLVRGGGWSWIALGGAVVVVAGLVAITGRSINAADVRSGSIWGVLSGLAYAVGAVGFVEASTSPGWWPAVAQRLTAALLMLAVAAAYRVPALPPRSQAGNALMLGAIVAVTSLLYLTALGFNPTVGVVALATYPAFSVIIGRVFFSDAIARRQVLGIALVVAGVAAVSAG